MSETEQQQEDDLLNLNETDAAETKPIADNGKTEPSQEEVRFNISDYQGFPIEQWVRYQGTLNDNRQRRRVAMAGNDKFKLRFNASGDDDIPEWKIMELQYYPLTVKAWQKRQSELADIEDKNREIGALDLQLSEIQNAIRIRALNAQKADESFNNKKTLEEIQKNELSLQSLNKNMKRDFQSLKNTADRYAFKIYFHKDPELFDKLRADDLEDIIGACDWRQMQGPSNLQPSKNLPTLVQPGVK